LLLGTTLLIQRTCKPERNTSISIYRSDSQLVYAPLKGWGISVLTI
jgi:hypothetical protein